MSAIETKIKKLNNSILLNKNADIVFQIRQI
jgi:hypothetical protein